MNNINTSGLEHFIRKLKKISDHPDLDCIHEKVAEIGVEEFNNAYNQHTAFGILDIKSEIIDSKNGKIVNILAIDDNQKTVIAFLEFGTGMYTDGGYQGKLPTQTLTFTTKQNDVYVVESTNGWEYYKGFDSDFKANVGGVNGWWFGGVFVDGLQTANTQNTFYKACQRIRERLSKELI